MTKLTINYKSGNKEVYYTKEKKERIAAKVINAIQANKPAVIAESEQDLIINVDQIEQIVIEDYKTE